MSCQSPTDWILVSRVFIGHNVAFPGVSMQARIDLRDDESPAPQLTAVRHSENSRLKGWNSTFAPKLLPIRSIPSFAPERYLRDGTRLCQKRVKSYRVNWSRNKPRSGDRRRLAGCTLPMILRQNHRRILPRA